MKMRAWLACLFLVGCAEAGNGDTGVDTIDGPATGNPGTEPPPAEPGDDEEEPIELPGEPTEPGEGTEPDGGMSEEPPVETPPADQMAEIIKIIEQLGELTTCKPSEINPALECATVTCGNKEPLEGVACLVQECASLAENIDSNCGACLFAVLSQDIVGMLGCLDLGAVLGGLLGGISSP